MSADEMNTAEALELGIVDEVVRAEELSAAAMRAARRFASQPLSSLLGIKRLVRYYRSGLKDYLSFESRELLKVIKAY